MVLSIAARIAYGTELKEMSRIDVEAWMKAWLERAFPIYKNSYDAFMGFIKEKKTQHHDIDLEANCFYDCLVVTREATSNKEVMAGIASLAISPVMKPDAIKMVAEIDMQLLKVESRCITKDGISYIAEDDLIKFIKIIVKLIKEVAAELTSVIEKTIEPFNSFIQDFDNTIKIDLIDGDYHLLVEQKLEDVETKLNKLQKETYKEDSSYLKPLTNEPAVYVICDKLDLANYVVNRWSEKIHLTPSAKDSLLNSGYSNLKALPPIFDILGMGFHDAYKNHTGIESSIDKLIDLNAQFKPKLSTTSKSKHAIFQTRYKSRVANFDRHICLGGSLSPERCFRLHFEWDAVEELIVIHHAGNHLPMSGDK